MAVRRGSRAVTGATNAGVAGSAPGLIEGRADAAPGSSPEHALPVSALTAALKDVIEGAFPAMWISGEVSGFKPHRNGHWYFTLKDAVASIDCVVWSRDQARMPTTPDEGMQVVALGQFNVWNKTGKATFAVRQMEAEGEGLWRKALEQTRAALEKDGLLDPARKRPIPRFPKCVAVITSASGAALHDIVSVIGRRNSTIDVVIIPAAVQGDSAPASIVEALRRAAVWGKADVLIVGRGGGSREDLWCFNSEAVARAIAASPIPTVSAVGHEVDITIADLVADHRAATPSAAAELVAPVLADLLADLRALQSLMINTLTRRARDGRRSLDATRNGIRSAVARRATSARRDLDVTMRQIRTSSVRVLERGRDRIGVLGGRLNLLSPLATLARGYALPRTPDGAALTSVTSVKKGARINIMMKDGEIDAVTEAVRLKERA